VKVRAFAENDVADVAALLAQLRGVGRPVEPLDAPQLRELLARPLHAGGRDFRVATHEGAFVAVAFTTRYTLAERARPIRELRLFVAHDPLREAAARSLVEAVLALDTEPVFRRAQDPAGESATLFASYGFNEVQRILVLRRRGIPQTVSALPPEVRLRDADLSEDTPALVSLVDVAHRDGFGFGPIDASELEALLRPPGARLLVAEHRKRAIGFVSTLPTRDGRGVLHLLQVSPEIRGQGLGRALAESAIHALAQQGFGEVEVHVDAANTVARTLYGRLGFSTHREDLVHERMP
jgi:ribosomal protein S18 acetylase RimI-like enzyme